MTVLLRPEHLLLRDDGDTATVELVEFYGHDTVYLVRNADGTLLRVRSSSVPTHGRGDVVGLAYVGEPAVGYAGRVAGAPV